IHERVLVTAADSLTSGGRAPNLSGELSGVRERSMIFPVTTTGRHHRGTITGFGIWSNAPGTSPSPRISAFRARPPSCVHGHSALWRASSRPLSALVGRQARLSIQQGFVQAYLRPSAPFRQSLPDARALGSRNNIRPATGGSFTTAERIVSRALWALFTTPT